MAVLLDTAFILSFLFALGLGFFAYVQPVKTIDLQKKFYESINWRIEPVSIPKEIRNTKAMGLFLMFLAFVAATYRIWR